MVLQTKGIHSLFALERADKAAVVQPLLLRLPLGAQIAESVDNNTEDQIDDSQGEYRPEGDVVDNTHNELFARLQNETT